MIFTKLLTSVRVCRSALISRVAVRGYSTTECSDPTAKADDKKDIEEGPTAGGNKKGLVLGVYEANDKFELSPAAEEMNQKSGGKICRYLNDISSELKLGKSFVVTDVDPEFSAVALASLGKKDAGYNSLEHLDETRENIRLGVGAGVSVLAARGCESVAVDGAGAADAAAEAAHLAAWRFEEFKSCGDRGAAPRLALHGPGPADAWEAGAALGRSQNWARYLSDMPANKMTPVDFAQEVLDVLCPLGVQVTAHERAWAQAQRMEAFLAVARGSCEPPVFLEAHYRAGGQRPPVLLAAKGVTFDSGGLCLKPAPLMAENRGSMAGAAVVVAAVRALAELKVPINVNVVIPLCENMVSGQCMKVGDVVKTLNGLSVQIEDTDLEGRLMLADALVYGQAAYKPSLVVDVATFTRGVLLATGGGAFGVFSNSAPAWNSLQAAGAHTGDRPWLFPLWAYYRRQITDDPAVDLRNKGSGTASPCIGAAFLKNFICGDWLHLDVTGVGKVSHAPAPPYLHARRMTGRPARTLAAFLTALADSPASGDGPPTPQ